VVIGALIFVAVLCLSGAALAMDKKNLRGELHNSFKLE
jgi:hypothetical protein